MNINIINHFIFKYKDTYGGTKRIDVVAGVWNRIDDDETPVVFSAKQDISFCVSDLKKRLRKKSFILNE